MKDKNEKLNLENFNKLAFELLKKENRNSPTINLNWNGNSLEKDEIKKMYKISHTIIAESVILIIVLIITLVVNYKLYTNQNLNHVQIKT